MLSTESMMLLDLYTTMKKAESWSKIRQVLP